MSLEQIEYVDKILPLFGCKDIADDKSLFNKTTITDWNALRKRLNIENMKTIFPTKTLNLKRLNGTISNQQQAIALLRGLLKIIGVGITIVRTSTSEYMRLSHDKKNLMYYIIHKNMKSTNVKQIQIKKDFPKDDLKITKKFYAKFSTSSEIKECDALPEKHKFMLVIGNEPIFRTKKLVYDATKDMWEIKFCSEILILNDDIPVEISDAFLLNLVTEHKVILYTKSQCQAFIEYYKDCPIMPTTSINTYIKYIDNHFGLAYNILTISAGMAGMKIGSRKNYYGVNELPYDPTADLKGFLDLEIDKQNMKRRILCNPVRPDEVTYPSRILIIGGRNAGKTPLCKKIINALGKTNICIFVSTDGDRDRYKEYNENVFTYNDENLRNCKDKDLYIFDTDGVNTKHICNFIRNNNVSVVMTVQIDSQIQTPNNELFDNVFISKGCTDIERLDTYGQIKIAKRFANTKYF